MKKRVIASKPDTPVSFLHTLSIAEAQAILAIEGGADVPSYETAGILRGIQRRGLPVIDRKSYPKRKRWPKNALFTITREMNKYGVMEKLPYFGAIASPYGVTVAQTTLAVQL